MRPDDITRFAEHFRDWLATAQNLQLVDLIRDSNSMVAEVTTIYENWDPRDPPLPAIIKPLYSIMCQIPPPPQVILVPQYFQQVITAVDEGRPIPPIPSYAYPTLRPLVDTPPIASIAAGKRKAPPVRQGVEPDLAHGKKQRTDKPAGNNQSEDSEDGDEGYEEDEEEDEDQLIDNGAGERINEDEVERTPMYQSKSADVADDGMGMDVDDDENGDGPYVDRPPSRQSRTPAPRSRGLPVVQITTKAPKTKKRSKSKPPKSRPIVVDDSDNDQFHPPAAQHTTPVTTKGLSPSQLEASWTAQTKGADVGDATPQLSRVQCENCVRDRVLCWTAVRSTACLNCRFVKKSRCQNTELSKKKEDVKVEGSQQAAGSKKLKKSSSRSKDAPSSSSLKITVPPVAPPQPASTSVAPAVISSSAAAPPKRPAANLARKRLSSSSRAPSTRAPAAPASNVHTPLAVPAPMAAPIPMAVPAPMPSPTPVATVDPLVCAPPTQEEPRYIPALYGTTHHTIPSKPTPMQDVPVGEIFARIGALEAEVRRLGQENSRLQETIVSRTEDVASRKEMGKLTKEIYRTSGRVGDLVTRVNTIDRYSSSSFTNSSAAPSDINTWAFTSGGQTNDIFGPSNTHPPVDIPDHQQYPPVSSNIQLDPSTTVQSVADAHSNTNAQLDEAKLTGTVNPSQLLLAHAQQQAD